MRVPVALLLVWALRAQIALADQPDALPAGVSDPAVPASVTICVDRAGQQCWTALGSAGCRSAARPAAEVFAIVPAEAPEEQLLRCMEGLEP
jgi:hypothetical protein